MDTLNTNLHTNEFNYDDQDGTFWAELFTPELPTDAELDTEEGISIWFDDRDDDEEFEQLTNEGEQS